MAIDTVQKRASALGLRLPFPDGDITAPDREQVLGQYAGIAAALPYPIPLLILPGHSRLRRAGQGVGRLVRAAGHGGQLVRASRALVSDLEG